ncbi:mitogen-activated protein kinase-binding protein 1-like isoform X6 [Pomacea canaliculata]|uniref:mitogen-activated protein kinase-binding protein 1-like isoform X6 n=1 Tax=Pomacea canaliculata TaxID=400727 RepID=UPI000D72A6A9|nr:mitogen-activated protein kinase-binding protein 1-like isoform X6 [Pomacea canaliculata]
MDKGQRKILRSPTVKRKSKVQPVGQRLTLERVLGLTVTSNAALSYDPVNGTIAYPAGCVVVLFNPRRNRQTHIFNSVKKTITSVAFSSDGKHLVTGECGHQPAVRVWDVIEKTQVAEFHGHKFGVNCVAFSPNLKYIVSIGSQHDMMVNVWNWRTGNKVASNKVSSKVRAVAFAADSGCFVTVGNRHVKFWYLDSSKSKINQTVPLLGRSGILGEQKNNFFCDVACGRGRWSGSTFVITQSGLLCEFNEKRLLDKWVELMTKSASCIAAGEEHIYVGCAEGVVRVFSTGTLSFVTSLPHPHFLGVEVATATTSSDMICTRSDAKYPDTIAIALDDDHKKVACIYNDHSLYLWDVLNIRRVGKAWSFLYHSGCIWALEVYPVLDSQQQGTLPPGSFITASSDDTIRVWNLESQMTEAPNCKRNIYSNELLKILYTDPALNFLCDVNYNPAGATDKTDTTWEGKNGVRSIRVSPDGEHLASGDRQGNVRIYDLRQMAEIKSIEAHESDVVCLEYSFSKAGPRILATGSRDRLIHVFDVEQKYGLLQTLDDHSAAIQSVRFTDSDNKLRMLSCGSDKSLLFRNACLNPNFEFSLAQHLVSKATMYDMIIDPTQKFVATACQDRNIRVYNMATAKQKKNYRGSLGDEGVLLRVQLDPSGTYAATSCSDKNLCVLEFYTGELVGTVYGHSEIVTGLRFTNDLKHLISVSADGCVFVWRLPSGMTKTMRHRMEELGQMPQNTESLSDLRREATLTPNPVFLDTTFHSPHHFPVQKENISPSRILAAMDLPNQLPSHPPNNQSTPVGKGIDLNSTQQSPMDYRFSVGSLPNWAKAKFGDGSGNETDGGPDAQQPKGRWAQRFDQNIAFKSQLDLTQLDDEHDQRRFTYGAGGLQTSMPDLRRETVVFKQHVPLKNIPIIDDDDETNIDDDEDFFPAYLNGKEANSLAESDRSSSDYDDRRGKRKSEPTGRRSDAGMTGRKWGSRLSLNTDRVASFDLDDADELDNWSDTTEVIYPPSDSETVDTYASTYQVFAVDEGRVCSKKKVTPASSSNMDEADSETTEPISLEDQDDDDPPDETQVSSSASTPSDPDHDILARTPDKEQFVKENFESVSFTPITAEKFAQHVASVEQAAEDSNSSNVPFSPRLSLSSRFLSRSHFGAGRLGLSGANQRPENWLDPLRKSKSEMARAMDETRRRLVDMNWRSGGLLNQSPDKDDPPSPPTKLENKEPIFTSPRSSQNLSSPGSKKEGDVSAAVVSSSPHQVPTSPSRTLPPSVKRTLTSSPTQGTNSLTSKENRRSNGTSKLESNVISSGAASQVRQAPSYFRTTKSSRLKSASSSSQACQVDALSNTKSGYVVSGIKGESGAKKRPGRGRLSAAKVAMHASTPNLAACFEEEESKMVGNTTKSAELPSNLRALADLSLSVPDINTVDDPPSTDSSSSDHLTVEKERSGPQQKSVKVSSSLVNSRHSVPPSSFISKMQFSLAKGVQDVSSDKTPDARLMPPPSAPPRTGHSGLLQRAAQLRKRSSELTLEQAKSILLGNSGILGARQNSLEEDSTAASPVSVSHSDSCLSSDQTTASLSSTLKPLPHISSASSHPNSSSCTVFDAENTNFKASGFLENRYSTARTLAVVQEIELTASQQRRERAAGAALSAERFDPPERDQPSLQRLVPNIVPASASCSAFQIGEQEDALISDSVTSRIDALHDMGMPDISVRERIARLNHQTSGHLACELGNLTIPFPRNANAAVGSPASVEYQISPRSQSDTGLGSETDTDSDMHGHPTPEDDLSLQNISSQGRLDRSRLSLQLPKSDVSSLTVATALSQESLQTCASILEDLKSAVQRAKDFHMQLQHSTSVGGGHNQMLLMMSAAFHETHLALAELALQSPASSDDSSKPLSCPLVGEASGRRDGAVIDKARDMLQPFVSQLSRELSDELIKLVKERLERNPS